MYCEVVQVTGIPKTGGRLREAALYDGEPLSKPAVIQNQEGCRVRQDSPWLVRRVGLLFLRRLFQPLPVTEPQVANGIYESVLLGAC